jgi:hypothetical protein
MLSGTISATRRRFFLQMTRDWRGHRHRAVYIEQFIAICLPRPPLRAANGQGRAHVSAANASFV